jgi:hypothetical protein
MSKSQDNYYSRLDEIKEFFLRTFVTNLLPGRWFNHELPPNTTLKKAALPINLEIVSHCWKYTEFQLYQLSSLVNNPPNDCVVTHTVYYSKEDLNTVKLLEYVKKLHVKNVIWNFIDLKKELLFRRAIGRNRAAKNTTADWIWFTDCDVVFLSGALDSLAKELENLQEILVYPETMLVSELLSKDDPIIVKARTEPRILQVDYSKFTVRKFNRAAGPIQILHGNIARACGYCDTLSVYQKPARRWRKAYEDRAFRWLLGTQGLPIKVLNLLFIRHAEKGRYNTNEQFRKLRKAIRRIKSKLIER